MPADLVSWFRCEAAGDPCWFLSVLAVAVLLVAAFAISQE